MQATAKREPDPRPDADLLPVIPEELHWASTYVTPLSTRYPKAQQAGISLPPKPSETPKHNCCLGVGVSPRL